MSLDKYNHRKNHLRIETIADMLTLSKRRIYHFTSVAGVTVFVSLTLCLFVGFPGRNFDRR